MTLLTACAGMETLIATPGVSLRHVEPRDLGLSEQVFVLRFDVTNPNPFVLPVQSIEYDVRLAGERFASGTAQTRLSIPASSDTGFAITVKLDLLHIAPTLLYALRDGIDQGIPYELHGELGVDLPFAKPIAFRHSGEVSLPEIDLRARFP